MDAAEPPRIAFDVSAPCQASDEASLREGLGASRAPATGWTVRAHIARDGAGLKATGEVADAAGEVAARRELTGSAAQCPGLSRSLGIWAGLVLDARMRADGSVAPDGAPVPSIGAASGDPAEAAPPRTPDIVPETGHHDDGERALELGAGLFVMSSTGGGPVAGPSVFGVFESGHGVYLRPSIAAGEAVTSLPPANVKSATWAAARFDACTRLPGLYSSRQGIQLDLCFGGDVGATVVEASQRSTLPYLGLGPSFDLRGELASQIAVVLRAMGGVDLVRESFVDETGSTAQPPLVDARLELACSWDIR